MRLAKRSILTLMATTAIAALLVSGVALSSTLSSDGDDRIDGTAEADVLRGQEGEDVIEGGAGDDALFAADGTEETRESGNTDSEDVLVGEDGDDTIIGASGANELQGGSGADSIITGTLNDAAVDRVFGGDDDDEIDSFNVPASKDVIDCGGGTDRARADSSDEILDNCEHVDVVPQPDGDMELQQ